MAFALPPTDWGRDRDASVRLCPFLRPPGTRAGPDTEHEANVML